MTNPEQMDLLRFTTAGSVDDGKSTLIGRLLYDSKSIFEDQLEAVELASKQLREEHINLALLTDGLRAEREQGITIDVAYRYFATPRRKFIIADTPGHEQYTRNMVTGASTANLAIVLIDARNGVMTQSKRHGFIASLLQIQHIIVAVNKMDLVDYKKEVFDQIVDEYSDFCQKLDVPDIDYIPISALNGDNVVNKLDNMPWYHGPALLESLETIHISSDRNLVDFRMPIQYVIRPNQDFRGYAGMINSGTLKVGEEVVSLPSGKKSTVKSMTTFKNDIDEAFAGQSVVVSLNEEIDISRGDMLVRKNNLPFVEKEFEAILCWMHETPMVPGKLYILQHTTQVLKAYIKKIVHKIDVNTLHRSEATQFDLNEIGRVVIKCSKFIFFDNYTTNKVTGNFIIVDPDTNYTVGAGMIRGAFREIEDIIPKEQKASVSPNVVREAGIIPMKEYEQRNNHKACVLWLTGLSGSGKSTIAKAFARKMFDENRQVVMLDGDNVRHGLCGDLGFSDEDRTENIRRVGEVAKLFFAHGNIVVCTFISPFRKDRDFVRSILPENAFFEAAIKCPLEICQQRDPKGLYKKAQSGEINEFTGISSPYEEPTSPEIEIETDLNTVEESVEILFQLLKKKAILSE